MTVTLDNGVARVTLRPDLGAGTTGYDFHDGKNWQPVFRRVPDDTDHPFQLSNILLVPFSGRVSGGGFTFEGRFHAIERNMPTEKYPIHGSAFALPWQIAEETRESLTLRLSATGPTCPLPSCRQRCDLAFRSRLRPSPCHRPQPGRAC